jgi:hypothetical protein
VCVPAVAGCGKQRVTVKGTLVLPANIQPAKDDHVSITFEPEEKGVKAAQAKFTVSDQSFVAQGVYPGRNRISVKIDPYPGNPGSTERAAHFARLNRAFEPGSTKLTHEVSRDSVQAIMIDLSRGTVTKK